MWYYYLLMCILQATFLNVRVIHLENIVCTRSFTSTEIINDTTSALEAQKAGLNFLPK